MLQVKDDTAWLRVGEQLIAEEQLVAAKSAAKKAKKLKQKANKQVLQAAEDSLAQCSQQPFTPATAPDSFNEGDCPTQTLQATKGHMAQHSSDADMPSAENSLVQCSQQPIAPATALTVFTRKSLLLMRCRQQMIIQLSTAQMLKCQVQLHWSKTAVKRATHCLAVSSTQIRQKQTAWRPTRHQSMSHMCCRVLPTNSKQQSTAQAWMSKAHPLFP